jgi:hypothetical protein
MGLGRRPQVTGASFSFVHDANIPVPNLHATCTPGLCGRVGTIHPLSTLLKPAFQGDNACWVLLAHLTHTTHDPLHASMAAALICMCSLSRTHHTLMITSSSACVTLAWPSLSWICQLFRRAQPRLTSAIIECVILAGSLFCRTKVC